MSEPRQTPGPLSGRKVLDFTQNLPGPYATFLLASMGADVIKVESPRGDPARNVEPFFRLVNRGKRAIVLDLQQEVDRATVRELVRWADVLVEGFRPGVMTRLGCDFSNARELNPKLIYCSISAFGQTGPRAQTPGHDLNLQALAGLCHLERDGRDRPRPTVLPVADLSSSLAAVASICAALASPTGEARHLDVAMSDALLSWVHTWGVGVDTTGPVRQAVAKSPARPLVERLLAGVDRLKLYAMPHYGLYRAGDGLYLALGIVDENHFWRGLCDALGLGIFRKLPLPLRTALGPVLRPIIAARLRTRGRDQWVARLTEAGVPATAVVRSFGEVAGDPQWLARGLIGPQGAPRAPLAEASHPRGDAPGLDEHGAEIRAMLQG